MFDTGEQIESGFSSGTLYYKGGNKKGTVEEIIDYLNSIEIEDLSPKVKPTKLGKSGKKYSFFVDFDTDNIYNKVHNNYNQDSYIKFSIWYKENFKLELNSNDADDRNFQEIRYITLDNMDEAQEAFEDKMEKFNISEEHREEAMQRFKENVIDVAESYKKEIANQIEARTNKMDKIFFPNELKEPFKNQKIEMINGEFCLTMPIKEPVSYDPHIKDNKSFFGKNEKGYYIGTSTELKENHNIYDFLCYENSDKLKYKTYKTFDEFMEVAKELFNKEAIEEPITFKLLKDFFESSFEKVKVRADSQNFVDNYLNKIDELKLIKRTNKNGKEFVNFKYLNTILSLDPKNPNIIKRWNIRERKEYPSIKSSVIYKKLAQENNFKLNKTKFFEK